jgi:hypothetical protein
MCMQSAVLEGAGEAGGAAAGARCRCRGVPRCACGGRLPGRRSGAGGRWRRHSRCPLMTSFPNRCHSQQFGRFPRRLRASNHPSPLPPGKSHLAPIQPVPDTRSFSRLRQRLGERSSLPFPHSLYSSSNLF